MNVCLTKLFAYYNIFFHTRILNNCEKQTNFYFFFLDRTNEFKITAKKFGYGRYTFDCRKMIQIYLLFLIFGRTKQTNPSISPGTFVTPFYTAINHNFVNIFSLQTHYALRIVDCSESVRKKQHSKSGMTRKNSWIRYDPWHQWRYNRCTLSLHSLPILSD